MATSDSRLTREQYGGLENNWAYTAAGALGTMTWGAVEVDGQTIFEAKLFEGKILARELVLF